MQFIFTKLTSLLRVAKLVAVMLVCTLYIAANTSPALAFGGASSKPSDGAAQLDSIYQESKESANPDADPKSMKAVQAKAKKGLNEVQGRADMGKMYNPSNSEGSTVADDIQETAKSAMGK
ncbi:hypothetical protein C1752_00317 [Acaryochloris thomasi RCC1774]|uniref:Low temperature-induced protein n=1 Tax=Acaryochloris thomasi RCC1774 TaxID=1764569 RepID=A0A2W1K205_9CYAN|nr:hypothetical protein [Acaryochloris thomasi]PZD75444.1 hypothetical protein C1752_00317 [Acaryochloris thomasi RCC1774]